MTWRIVAWSREHGRAEVVPSIGTIPFDTSVVDVDDFTVGELVEVCLQPDGDSWAALRIWPDTPYFRPPAVEEGTSELDRSLLAPIYDPRQARGRGGAGHVLRFAGVRPGEGLPRAGRLNIDRMQHMLMKSKSLWS